MQKWIERMNPGVEADGQRPPMRFRFIHPGAIVSNDVLVPAPLPPNMSIGISKEGDQPAKIAVKRGDEKWEVTEKELDKLPADVRPHVERMLGRGPLAMIGGRHSFDFVPEALAPGDQFQSPVPSPGAQPSRGPGLLERMEKRFDEMNHRMDKLFKALDDLGEEHAQHKALEKPTEQRQQK